MGKASKALECVQLYRLAFPNLDVPMCQFYARSVCPRSIQLHEWIDLMVHTLIEVDDEAMPQGVVMMDFFGGAQHG